MYWLILNVFGHTMSCLPSLFKLQCSDANKLHLHTSTSSWKKLNYWIIKWTEGSDGRQQGDVWDRYINLQNCVKMLILFYTEFNKMSMKMMLPAFLIGELADACVTSTQLLGVWSLCAFPLCSTLRALCRVNRACCNSPERCAFQNVWHIKTQQKHRAGLHLQT